jgi:hypothetical protein
MSQLSVLKITITSFIIKEKTEERQVGWLQMIWTISNTYFKKLKGTQKFKMFFRYNTGTQWNSVCAPFVALHIPHQYSIPTFYNKRWSTLPTHFVRSSKFSKVTGSGETNSILGIVPQKKDKRGYIWWNQWPLNRIPWPIQWSTSLWTFGGTSPCWKPSGILSSNWQINQSAMCHDRQFH